jgi:cytochrome c oxidase subunit 1
VCGPYEYAIGVDQMGRGLPEPPGPGGAEGPDSREGRTGPEGPMHKETEVVG